MSKKRVSVRKLVSVVVAAGLLASLSACASGPFASNSCDPTFTAGTSSDLVSAPGTFAADPRADFPTPLVSKHVEVSTVLDGDGAVVATGDSAVLQITIYDGTSGDQLISTDYAATGLLSLAVDGLPQFGGVAQCATVGSRVAATGPAGEIIGAGPIEQYGLPVTEDSTVVLVVDVKGTYLGRANGADQVAEAGFPSVVLAPDGRPGLTFTGDAPSDLRISTLKAGNGAEVAEGDAVVVQYTGVLWNDDKTVFDSTWDRGAPSVLNAVSLNDSTGGVVDGFAQAIVGAKVGSQVIAVIPPEFGYPTGGAPSGIPDGSTLVFVIDILGIAE